MGLHLVYRVSAALGSMGLVAGNERRGTHDWPARSAVSGLIGAALGVRRTDRDALQALEHDYATALSRVTLGPLLEDFHTVQAVPTAGARRPASRPRALALGKARGTTGTIITHREYHEVCVFDVAIVALVDDPRWSLDRLREALLHPHFVLYFGRKACPLDRPLDPRLIEAPDTIGALEDYAGESTNEGDGHDAEFLVDPQLIGGAGGSQRSIIRRDGVVDRERWVFTDRESVLVNKPGRREA